ncbi:MAG: hypothetical protein NUW09_01435 [Deltaproteobacteria bacterium]|nr:hypothetical protein [Deltaproteobacteria bacterium]
MRYRVFFLNGTRADYERCVKRKDNAMMLFAVAGTLTAHSRRNALTKEEILLEATKKYHPRVS